MLDQVERVERSQEFSPCGGWTSSSRKALPSFGSLVAEMSHDLRIPLSAILANAEFLAQSNLSESERTELYEEIRLSVHWMNQLVTDLLECSVEAAILHRSIGDIVETIARVVKIVAVRPAFRRISIAHRHEGSRIGWYNSRLLERALSNVVLNACEAVPSDSGRVAITTVGGPTCLRVEIWDNGPGIGADIQGSVFQPLFTNGKPEGTGLGLAIAKRLVESHGGEIVLDAGDGNGTSFKISIPFAIPDGASRGGPAQVPADHRHNGSNILRDRRRKP